MLSSVQFGCSVVSNSLWPRGLHHASPLCPSATPGAYSNSYPLSWWCHPTISSSVIPFSSHLQSCPASGSVPMSRLFASGGQSIGVSASASVLPMHESFPGMSCSLNCLFLPECNPLVLKHRFYYYLGPAKPADEETTTPEKTQFVTHSSQEERGAHGPTQSHMGKHQGLSGDGRSVREKWETASAVV